MRVLKIFTGLVTTTQVTHASPAGVYAHTANRNWESNQALLNDGGDPETCTDIAQQLINGKVGSKLKVLNINPVLTATFIA